MLLLHVVFGLLSFVGAMMLGVAFKGQLRELSRLQQWAVGLSYTGTLLTAILGILSASSHPIIVLMTLVGTLAFTKRTFLSADQSKEQ